MVKCDTHRIYANHYLNHWVKRQRRLVIKQDAEAFFGPLFGHLVTLLNEAMQGGSSAMTVLIMRKWYMCQL